MGVIMPPAVSRSMLQSERHGRVQFLKDGWCQAYGKAATKQEICKINKMMDKPFPMLPHTEHKVQIMIIHTVQMNIQSTCVLQIKSAELCKEKMQSPALLFILKWGYDFTICGVKHTGLIKFLKTILKDNNSITSLQTEGPFLLSIHSFRY